MLIFVVFPFYTGLCQALRQRRAKKAGEQWNSKRAKNGGKIIQVLYASMPNIDVRDLHQQLAVWFEPKKPVAKFWEDGRT